MNVYIDKDYFDILENLKSLIKTDVTFYGDKKSSILQFIYNILISLDVHTEVTNTEVSEYIKQNGNGLIPTNLRDAIIAKAILDNRLVSNPLLEKVKDFSGIYFLMKEIEESAKKFGIISEDSNFSGNSFYDKHTITDKKFKGDISTLKNTAPPSNAMIIIDRYIFDDSKKKDTPIEQKLNSLIELVKIYKANITDIPFQLTIITSLDTKIIPQENGTFQREYIINKVLINNYLRKLKEIGNIEIQVILSTFYLSNSPKEKFRDREVYTNYCSINFGHPFDETRTHFSQNMLPIELHPQQIKTNYDDFKTQLRNIKELIWKAKSDTKFQTSFFTNRLFDMLPKE